MRSTEIKYFLYARKSSESEDRQMASIDDQIAEVKKIAEKYNLQVVEIISESKSAKAPGREGFNSMLQRIHNGEAQGILTWKLNRLARNPIDGGQISWMLQQNIIRHIQTFERDYNPADNVLLMQVEFGMANQYIKDLSLDVSRGMRQKAERGWYPIMQLPIGYIHKTGYILGVDDEIVPNSKQYPILKNLWDLFLTGKYSIADIKRKGDAMGLVHKNGKLCSKNAYYYIFTNEFYCGYFYWKDKNGDLIKLKGRHKPLISLAEFHKAQVLLGNKSTVVAKCTKLNFPYRGIIKCGECGCAVTTDHKLQAICTNCKYKFSIKKLTACPKCGTEVKDMKNPSIVDILYYHCTKANGKCYQGSITKNKIEMSVENELSKISIHTELYNTAMDYLKDRKAILSEEENVISDLKKSKLKIEKRISGLISLRADGEIDSEQFNTSLKKAQKELSDIGYEISEVERKQIDWFEEREKDFKFALEALEKFKKADDITKTQMVKDFVSNLTMKDKELYFSIKKPFLELKDIIFQKTENTSKSNLKLSYEI